MNPQYEQALVSKIRNLSPQQVVEVEDFVEFLCSRKAKDTAFDRLLALAPALEAAGAQPVSIQDADAEVKAARAERRANRSVVKDAHADRS